MSLEEIEFLLEDAKETLVFIETSYIESVENEEISIALKTKIKHFLEDINSSLDYIGYDIFKRYCQDYITADLDNHLARLYFPSKNNENSFNVYIKNMYPNLAESKPDVVELFESIQPFTSVEWFKNLKDLVNKSKHRELTPQERQINTHITNYDSKTGRVLSSFNHGFIYADEDSKITVDGMPWDNVNQIPIPTDERGVILTHYVGFVFKNSGLNVIHTLKEIYEGSTSLFIDLKKLI